jgi:hypothetical protein
MRALPSIRKVAVLLTTLTAEVQEHASSLQTSEAGRGKNHVRRKSRPRTALPSLLMVDLIDDFFAEYPPTAGGSDKVDTDEADEVIHAIAKR